MEDFNEPDRRRRIKSPWTHWTRGMQANFVADRIGNLNTYRMINSLLDQQTADGYVPEKIFGTEFVGVYNENYQ